MRSSEQRTHVAAGVRDRASLRQCSECILSASFFVVRQYSGLGVVTLTESHADAGQTRLLTNRSEQHATPRTTKLRNWVSGVRIPPGAPLFVYARRQPAGWRRWCMWSA